MTTPSRYCHTCWNLHPYCVCSKPANPESTPHPQHPSVYKPPSRLIDEITDAIVAGIIDPFHRLPPHPRDAFRWMGMPGAPNVGPPADLDDYDPVLEATRALYLDEGTT